MLQAGVADRECRYYERDGVQGLKEWGEEYLSDITLVDPHPVIVAIGDHSDYIRAPLYPKPRNPEPKPSTLIPLLQGRGST